MRDSSHDPAPGPAVFVTENGPYVVRVDVPLTIATIEPDDRGGSWTWNEGRSVEATAPYALCRCGESAAKPFCDGSHVRAGFDGTETAERSPFGSGVTTIDGPAYTLRDAERLCAYARFCDNAGGIWSLVPAASDDATIELVVREASSCPSGRLVLRANDGGEDRERDFSRSIALVQDPVKDCSGPLWLRGGLGVASADGAPYDVRNRQTLCRCGRSANKPFCDGAHADAAFRDGLA